MHTTNYFNTFIEIAEDSPVNRGVVPTKRNGAQTIASLQYDMIARNPYEFTSDDVLFEVHLVRKEDVKAGYEEERKLFFSKGQPCFRSSPLTKRYGWGIHSNHDGRIAIIAAGTSDYVQMLKDKTLTHKKAMRSKRD